MNWIEFKVLKVSNAGSWVSATEISHVSLDRFNIKQHSSFFGLRCLVQNYTYETGLSVLFCALRFITGCGYCACQCKLDVAAGCPSLSVHRQSHLLLFVHKCILGLLPSYLSTFMMKSHIQDGLCSQALLHKFIPRDTTELRI